MKKILSFLLLLVVVLLAFVYVFIPSLIKVSGSTLAPTTSAPALLHLSTSNYWRKWFYPPNDSNNLNFVLGDCQFIPNNFIANQVSIDIVQGTAITNSKINVLPYSNDSIMLVWAVQIGTGNNPFSRLKQYYHAIDIEKKIGTVLKRYDAWVSNTANVYGVPVVVGSIQDSILITTSTLFRQYPGDTEIYALFQKLRDHFTKYGVQQTGYPMLSVMPARDGSYRTQVAIPISKEITGTPDIFMKHMFKGRALTVEINGGNKNIEQGFKAMQRYFMDYDLKSPAISFQSVITNRMVEKDTSKWITKLYYPVY